MNDFSKLDSRAKYILTTAQLGEVDPDSQVGVLIRGRANFSSQQLADLEADGAHIRTVAGDILTADVPIKALALVMQHDFVRQLQLSEPLYPEEPESPTLPFADVE